MRTKRSTALLALALSATILAAASILASAQTPATPHVFFRVKLADSAPGPVSGRLLVFLKKGSGDKEVNIQEFHPADTSVAAQEVHHLMPGASVDFYADATAYPAAFSTLPAADYEVQAVLDTEHTYNYSGRTPSDWITPVLTLAQWTPGSSEPTLTLDTHPAENPMRAPALAKAHQQVKPGVIEEQEMLSPLLTRFSGNPTSIRAWVVLPPGYQQNPTQHYPTVYYTHGFGGSLEYNIVQAAMIRGRMDAGTMPPMIWVMLDESCPQGTHEFADSVNNGPWGTALTTEFIPMLEQKYRMDAKPTGRFLNGHSSGGWATLQLQINFPQVFGGTWSTSPDPSDFHNFTGPDLYAPHANAYHRPDGTPYPIMRVDGKVVATLEQFTKIEAVLGPYGGQITSFDWVFSPRSKSGAPMPMFDRVTGDVNPTVVAYWHDHYDLAHLVEEKWPTQSALLKGRIHLFVGTADTFYLDSSAHFFDARLAKLGADAHFTYIPGRTHMDLYGVGKDHYGLFDQIATEMYAVARPGVAWKKAN
ncbi:MAG TPA: alpha/beta hydrolase-fold protein [Acidobacteriaceae bacterium]|nr:alpha/beta hydrolase-fold protein [Acidobacteriaceae bacterium]